MARPFPVGVKVGTGGLARVARSTPLRRAQLSFGLTWASEWALLVGLGVFAFREGGAAAVGALTAVTGYPASAIAGERVVTARLEALRAAPEPSAGGSG